MNPAVRAIDCRIAVDAAIARTALRVKSKAPIPCVTRTYWEVQAPFMINRLNMRMHTLSDLLVGFLTVASLDTIVFLV